MTSPPQPSQLSSPVWEGGGGCRRGAVIAPPPSLQESHTSQQDVNKLPPISRLLVGTATTAPSQQSWLGKVQLPRAAKNKKPQDANRESSGPQAEDIPTAVDRQQEGEQDQHDCPAAPIATADLDESGNIGAESSSPSWGQQHHHASAEATSFSRMTETFTSDFTGDPMTPRLPTWEEAGLGKLSSVQEDKLRKEDSSIQRLRDRLLDRFGSPEKAFQALDRHHKEALSFKNLRDALLANSIDFERGMRGPPKWLREAFRVLDYNSTGRLTMKQLMLDHPRLHRRRILAREHFIGPEFEGEEDVFEYDEKPQQATVSLDGPHVDLVNMAEGGGMSEWMRRVEKFSQEQTIGPLLLEYRCIGAQGALHLVRQLHMHDKFSSLRELQLIGNYIGDRGARYIARALEGPENGSMPNVRLETLGLAWNAIGDDGAVRLARTITQVTTLKQLDMAFNRISSRGAGRLAEALTMRPALRMLKLQGNRITEAWANTLRDSSGPRVAVDVKGLAVVDPESSAPPKDGDPIIAQPEAGGGEGQAGAAGHSEQPAEIKGHGVTINPAASREALPLPPLPQRRGGLAAVKRPALQTTPARPIDKPSPLWSCDPAHPLPNLPSEPPWMREGPRITCTKFAKATGPRPLTRMLLSRSGREQLIQRRKEAFFPGLAQKPVTPFRGRHGPEVASASKS